MQIHDVYKCDLCGNIVKMVAAKAGTLNCCGKPMVHLKENTVDASKEKHVPVIERSDKGITVKVGSVAHPMEDKHFIQWIEIIADGKNCIQMLNPGDKPEAFFPTTAQNITVREYCNLHGLWKA